MTGGKAVQVVFAANNSAYRSRKRAHRACEQCKSRRRKCPPPFENHERCASCAQDGIQCSLALVDSSAAPTTQWIPEEPRDDNEDISQGGISDKNPRFIGDLNPQSVFLTAAKDSTSPDVATDRDEVGVWVSQSPEPLLRSKGVKRRFQDQETSRKPTPTTPTAESGPEKHLKAYITSLNAYARPTRPCIDVLLSLYLSSIHPLYPIIDDSTCALFKSPDKISTLLLQSVLLVASRHPDAITHLRLSASGDLLKPQEFALRLETHIKGLLYADDERDRMVLIRVYALLSLSGGNEASRNLALAIHHAHSLGLHIRNSRAEELWWCLWTLDKLLAAMNGRPILVKLEDVSIDRPAKTREGKGAAFRVMVKLAELLEEVIALYRPGNESCWEHQFPEFAVYLQGEEVPEEGGQLAILELFYYAISILSHRTRSQSTQTRGNSHARRLRAASNVLRLLQETKWVPLPPTPVLPYALSLALTTFYARVREGDGECMAEYSFCIDRLTYYGEWWWVAGAMAKLGLRAMNSGGKRRAVEKECAAVLSSLKSTGEEGPNGHGVANRESIITHKMTVSVPAQPSPPSAPLSSTQSSPSPTPLPSTSSSSSTPPSSKRRLMYSKPQVPVVPRVETNIDCSNYSTYNQVMPMAPPLVPMRPPQVAYTPTPHLVEIDDAAFTGVDIFLLDQFSNPSNPLDFDSFDFDSSWLNGGAEETNFGMTGGGTIRSGNNTKGNRGREGEGYCMPCFGVSGNYF